MKSWKIWGCVLALLVASALACFGGSVEDEGLYNLDAPPTDGGTFASVEDCAGKEVGSQWCIRDGDERIVTCQSDSLVLESPCEDDADGFPMPTFCYGARDLEQAACMTEVEIAYETEQGVEPGSDLWQQEKDASAGGSGGSCCKVCTSSKACGDSCISKSKTCNVGRGCACNG